MRGCWLAQHYTHSFILFSSHPILPPKCPADVRIPAENRKPTLTLMLGRRYPREWFHPWNRSKSSTRRARCWRRLFTERNLTPSSSIKGLLQSSALDWTFLFSFYIFICSCICTYFFIYICMCSLDHISLKKHLAKKGELMVNEHLLQLLSWLPPYYMTPGKSCACWLAVQMGKPPLTAITPWDREVDRDTSLHRF